MPASLSCTVKFTIKVKDLASMDWMSKTDPIAVLYEQVDGKWVERGRTEWIKNNYSPTFATKLEMEYFFEHKQNIKVDIVDVDDPKAPLGLSTTEAQLCGCFESTISKVVSARNGIFEMALTNPKKPKAKNGTITIISEVQKGRKGDKVRMVMEGIALAAKDSNLMSAKSSDPFYIVKRFRKNSEEVAYEYKSETINAELNPTWKPMMADFSQLCNGDVDEKFRLEVYDEDMMKNDMIGFIDVSLNELLKGPVKLNDRPGGRTENPGSVRLKELEVFRTPNLLDYIQEGCELTASVAVDFTASNKPATDPDSLHYLGGGPVLNQYQEAIIAVTSILIDYDSDKKVTATGYGAIAPPARDVSHLFPLNGGNNISAAQVDGVEGLLSVYDKAVQTVTLHGPTNFAPTISHVAMMARESKRYAYHVLLIITDGDITDMQETIAAIVAASDLPMSIIIIGVGDEDFDSMEMLDCSKGKLKDETGKEAARDIVQFVAFKKCQKNARELESQVLAELPTQLLSYMCSKQQTPAAWAGTVFKTPEGQWFKA